MGRSEGSWRLEGGEEGKRRGFEKGGPTEIDPEDLRKKGRGTDVSMGPFLKAKDGLKAAEANRIEVTTRERRRKGSQRNHLVEGS